MTLRDRLPHWFRPAAYLSHNAFTMVGAVLAISSAFTVVGFWIYDFTTGGTINPYIGLIFILILPGIFVVGLAMMPIGRSLASPQTKSRRQASWTNTPRWISTSRFFARPRPGWAALRSLMPSSSAWAPIEALSTWIRRISAGKPATR